MQCGFLYQSQNLNAVKRKLECSSNENSKKSKITNPNNASFKYSLRKYTKVENNSITDLYKISLPPIPIEIFCDILQCLPRNEVEKCQLVNKQWHAVVDKYSFHFARHKIFNVEYNTRNKEFYIRKDLSKKDVNVIGQTSEKWANLLKISAIQTMKLEELNLSTLEEMKLLKQTLGYKIPIQELQIGSFFSIASENTTQLWDLFTSPFKFSILLNEADFSRLLIDPSILKAGQQKEIFVDFSRAFNSEDFVVNVAKFLVLMTSKEIPNIERFTFGTTMYQDVSRDDLASLCCSIVFQLFAIEDPSKVIQHYRFRLVPDPDSSQIRQDFVNYNFPLPLGWLLKLKYEYLTSLQGETEEYICIDMYKRDI